MYKHRGFTLIELAITLVIVGIIVALAIPSFWDLIERKHLSGAVEAAYEQLEFARSQAVKRSKPILVDFNVDGTDWSIGVTDKMGGCDAEDTLDTDDAPCTVDYDNDGDRTDAIIMRIHGGDYKSITMSQAAAFTYLDPPFPPPLDCTTTSGEQGCFDYVQGLARKGYYNFTSTNDKYTLQLQVSRLGLGRLNVCVPVDAEDMVGYNGCL